MVNDPNLQAAMLLIGEVERVIALPSHADNALAVVAKYEKGRPSNERVFLERARVAIHGLGTNATYSDAAAIVRALIPTTNWANEARMLKRVADDITKLQVNS